MEGFTKLAAPLQKLVAEFGGTKSKKRSEQGVTGHWTKESNYSFESLMSKLTTASVLTYAYFSLLFILEVGASHGGLGPVLLQEQEGRV